MKAWLAVAMAACIALAPLPALAHPKLIKTQPAKGAILKKAPAKIQLRFHEELDTRGSSFTVVNSKKERVDKGDGRVNLDDRTLMEGSVGPLPPGVYTVKWKAVADDDKGLTEGTFTFRVRE
jgi:methionine-rich copper-binding protein CopC